jgi:hypothetical protein
MNVLMRKISGAISVMVVIQTSVGDANCRASLCTRKNEKGNINLQARGPLFL